MKKSFFVFVFVLFLYQVVQAQEDTILFESDMQFLSDNINSEYTESDARISPDGKTLYFIRWKYPYNTGGETAPPDIYFSKLDKNGNWSEAVNLGPPFNDETFNMVVGIRSDGNAMIITGKYDEVYNTNLYVSYKKNGKWQDIEPMMFENLDYKIISRGFFVTSDFKTLVFADREKGKYGKSDLFVSFFQDNGKWSEPLYMGDDLNTSFHEEWPILANDKETVYFSSNGYSGYGNGDIYMSRRLDDSWTKWSEPVNLGEKINSENFDADFIVDTQGKYAYFSHHGLESSKLDICKILLSEKAKPKPVVLVKGNVYNQSTNNPLEVEVVYFDLKTNEQLGKAYSDKTSGGYKIVLPYGKKYGFMANAEGFASVSENIDLSEENKSLTKNIQYQQIKRDLFLVPIKKGNVVRMNNLFFETASAVLTKDSYMELKTVIELLKNNPEMKIRINGHTDNVGSNSYNLDLSEKRAIAVKKYLVSKGVSSNRLSTKGFGEEKPFADNNTAKGRKKNRRVEFEILEN